MANKRYWLMKSEPYVYSLADLERDGTTHWDGVRNYQARNLMRGMSVGDGVLYYHSNEQPMAIIGLAKVCREAYPDFTQFDPRNRYYDAKASDDKPRWFMVDIEFVRSFPQPLTLAFLREQPSLKGMALLKKGQRLSVQPVTASEWGEVCQLAGVAPTFD